MRELIKKVNKAIDKAWFKILFGISFSYSCYSILNLQKLLKLLGVPNNIFFEGLGIVGIIVGILFLTMGIFEIALKEKEEDQNVR